MMNIEIIRNKRIIGNKKGIGTIFILGLLLLLPLTLVNAAATAPPLGAADSFAVLAGTTVTNTGSSVITGDVGVSPGTAVTGFPPGIVVPPGTIHSADTLAGQAQTDLTTAYDNAAGQTPATTVSGDIGGQTLTYGIYHSTSSLGITGTLTLDALGDPDAVFIFQMGSTLTTATDSKVVLINGAQARNVFWQVGSSATLGTRTTFVGNILALTSITLVTGATVDGRLLARNGAVTLDSNIIGQGISIVPEIESCHSDGAREDTFIVWDTVYAKGSGFAASTTYPIYVVSDVNWADGMDIPSRVTGSVTTVASNTLGGIPATSVWTNAQLGKYDIVVDVDRDGKYDVGIDALDNNDIAVTAGFFVVPETPIFTTLIAVIAAGAVFIAFKKRSNFHS